MSAWGVSAFDNDDANDWAYGLEGTDDLLLVISALGVVEAASDYLEAPDAANALAACEVLARLKGNAGYRNPYTEKVDEWVASHPIKPTPELIAQASSVIDRILGTQSELRELWEQSDNNAEWQASVEDLRNRMC